MHTETSVHKISIQRASVLQCALCKCAAMCPSAHQSVHQSAPKCTLQSSSCVQQCAPVARRVPVINLSDLSGPRWTGQMLTVAVGNADDDDGDDNDDFDNYDDYDRNIIIVMKNYFE